VTSVLAAVDSGLVNYSMQLESGRASSESAVYELTSILERLELSRLFSRQQPLEIELGSGDGSFLVQYAQQNPNRNFIGVERLLGRLRKLDRKARRLELANVRAIQIESSYLLRYLLPPGSAAAIHIYFPDPWPKRKHRRHRLVSEGFPALARQALADEGMVFLRTDDTDYFKQMKAVFGSSPLFEPADTPEALAGLLTDFERGFLARGVSTLRAAYRAVRASPDAPTTAAL
jgi:tRNA (guanine-N7-)-methyltransferase